MNKITLITALLTSFISFGQYPIVEEFDNTVSGWTFDNGSGVQNYGGSETYATFNLGSSPYFNNTTHTILSPVYDLTDIVGNVTISFPFSGIIENGWDYFHFDYLNGSVWVTEATYTGSQNLTHISVIPNTATRFRLQLIADGSVNTYWWGGSTYVYYYDFERFTINGDVSALPIELYEFYGNCNSLHWSTSSENNNEYFLIESSLDGNNWRIEDTINGAGNSLEIINYSLSINPIGFTYYRLTQYDFNGDSEVFKIISIDCSNDNNIIGVYDVKGRDVGLNVTTSGLYFVLYSNGNVKRILK
tara:strand:+ start:259 stop:1167 length:909 start_codon:yes stop_codon:yes gene_type:complete